MIENNTHARIADYMQKMKDQKRNGKAKSTEVGRERLQIPMPVKRVVPTVTHIVQAMAQPQPQSGIMTRSPFSAVQRQTEREQAEKGHVEKRQAEKGQAEKEPVRHTSVSRRSEASGASVASKHSIFSTPGRDEMERKKPIVEEDEGPFAKATNMQDLEQRRRKVSEGTKVGGEEEQKRRFCGMQCMIM